MLLTWSPQVLQVVRADAETLAGSTGATAELAEKVSRKVRQLDLAQSRVQATLERINLVVDRMRAIEGIKEALEQDDFEAGAQCVARYLELEDEFGDALADGDSRQAQEHAKVSSLIHKDNCTRMFSLPSCLQSNVCLLKTFVHVQRAYICCKCFIPSALFSL